MKSALEKRVSEMCIRHTLSVLHISQYPWPWTLGGNESNKDRKLQARQLCNGDNQWQPCWSPGLHLIEIDTRITEPRRMKKGKQMWSLPHQNRRASKHLCGASEVLPASYPSFKQIKWNSSKQKPFINLHKYVLIFSN